MKKIASVVLNDFTNDSRVWKMSRSFVKQGFSPIVVAMYSDGLMLRESVDGVSVERIKLASRPWPKWKLVQIFKYIEFLVRAFWRFRGVDIVHCNDLNALPVGVLIKFFGGGKVVYDCHEYETETNGLKGLEKKAKKWLERMLIPFADKVCTVSDSIANEYARIYKITKPALVMNCPSFVEIKKRNIFRETLGIRSDQKIFLYQGSLSKGRGVEVLLDAFADFESDEAVLVCMGYGPLEALVRAKSEASNTVFIHPAVSPDVLLDYTCSADYGVSFIEDVCLSHRYCLPNKMFEYIMAGIPVLTSDLFEMKKIVESEGVGIVAASNTVQGFQGAVKKIQFQNYSDMQKRVFSARGKYCWEEQEVILKEIYNAI
ncbi:glycosyltransferase [Alcanivorax sp.]|uniref:glycosyltransferase n=1 Tax=Alcanivorax sp. TaxID=1872427 RepID=UPI000C10B129|nr:glycosyltransferase [Alcanivorax sp.]PHR67308.1 MAG: glycosyl transferase family 1 [Alcanivorax sp.]